ncbi:unnamed protein product [Effrenium voratum]|uniref:SET domain-containing protein n=1 Tax=Effrenium voratum TaxID=2562239 RepID=A0AA36JBM6_9DINO|nr:unnamed protein product [Effrenium voratum]
MEQSFPLKLVSTTAGRGYAASRDLRKGEVVLRVAPVSAVLHDDMVESHCSRCLQPFLGLAPAPCRCGGARFCRGCRRAPFAQAEHRAECRALAKLRDGATRRRLGLRGLKRKGKLRGHDREATSMLRLAVRLLARRRRSLRQEAPVPLLGDKDGAWLPEEDVVHDSWRDVEALAPAEDELDAMVETLQPDRAYQLEGGANAVRLLVTAAREEIYHLLCRLAFNAMALVPEEPLRAGQGRWRDTGIGLYPTGAMLNHSCSPTCLWFMRGGILVVETQKSVKRGQELTVAYLPTTGTCEVRRKRLRKAFGFTCQCRRCCAESRPKESARASRNFLVSFDKGSSAAEVLQWKRLAARRDAALTREEKQDVKVTQAEYCGEEARQGFQSNRRTRAALVREGQGSLRFGA